MSQPIDSLSSRHFILLSLFTGLVGAFVYPLISYFLIEELGKSPVYIGIYMVSITLSGLVISQYLAKLADKGVGTKKLYMLANTGVIIALCIYIVSGSFWLILGAGICFMAFGNASIPMMLTLSRQWANKSSINITKFNAQLRASISMAWMLGPPLGFSIIATSGFNIAFSLAILFALVGIMFVWQRLPEPSKDKLPPKLDHEVKATKRFWYLAAAVAMGSMANNMYTSSLALYTITELQLPGYTPGLLMGLVAGLEIPIMLNANKFCRFMSKTQVMALAFVFGGVFYLGMFFATTLWQLIALQLVNAIFYGLFAGVGLTLMQEQIPERVGFTSAVYSNAFKIGVMCGASIMGLIAQFSSFQFTLIGAFLASSTGIIFLKLFAASR